MTKYVQRIVEEVYKRGVIPTSTKTLVELLCSEYGLEKRKASKHLANVMKELVKKGLVEKVRRGYYRASSSLLPLPLPTLPSSPSSKVGAGIKTGGSGVEALRGPRIICLRSGEEPYFVTCNDPEGIVKHLMEKFKIEDILAKIILCAYVDYLSGLHRLFLSRTVLGILDYHKDIVEELKRMTVFVESAEELERLFGRRQEAPRSSSVS
jgi:hypothetical protein